MFNKIITSSIPGPIVPEEDLYTYVTKDWIENLDEVALVDTSDEHHYTYKQVLDIVARLTSDMTKSGLESGSIVSIWCSNCVEMILVSLAAWRLGVAVAMIGFSLTAEEAYKQVQKVKSAFLFFNSRSRNKISKFLDASFAQTAFTLGSYEFVSLQSQSRYRSASSCHSRKLSDTVLILFSSGTTGYPKAVQLTHINMVTALSLTSAKYTQRRVPAALIFLPLTHFFGLASTLRCLNDRIKLLVMPKFELEEYLKLTSRHQLSSMVLVPSVAVMMIKRPELFQKYDLSSVFVVFSSGAMLSVEAIKALQQLMPGAVVAITQGYGLTEATGSITSASSPNMPLGAVGSVMPFLELKIINMDTGELCNHFENGEILMRGPTVMKGYFDDPKATAEMIDKDGWLHTGDVGYYDENEYIFIVDRIKELIKHKGQQVAPAELEDVLLSHPNVADVAVVGIPDEVMGELPMAFIVLKSSSQVTEKQFQDYLAERVAPYKRLTGGVKFVSSIPKLPTGKILRRLLRDSLTKPKL